MRSEENLQESRMNDLQCTNVLKKKSSNRVRQNPPESIKDGKKEIIE